MNKKEVATVVKNDVLEVKKTKEKLQVISVVEKEGLYSVKGYLANGKKAVFDSKDVTAPTGEKPFIDEAALKANAAAKKAEPAIPRRVALAKTIVKEKEAKNVLTQAEYDAMNAVPKRNLNMDKAAAFTEKTGYVLKIVGSDKIYVIKDARVKNLSAAKRVFNNYFEA